MLLRAVLARPVQTSLRTLHSSTGSALTTTEAVHTYVIIRAQRFILLKGSCENVLSKLVCVQCQVFHLDSKEDMRCKDCTFAFTTHLFVGHEEYRD